MRDPVSKFDAVMDVIITTQGSGAGGNTFATITVPKGEIWEVVMGIAYHDDVARNCQWSISDGTDSSVLSAVLSCAGSVPMYLADGYDGTSHVRSWLAPPIMRYGQQIAFTAQAMAGAKTITVKLVVNKLRGAELWA